jgi:hypothetical protein
MIKSIIGILKSYWELDVVPFFRIMFSASNKSTQEVPSGLRHENTIESYVVKSKDDAVGLDDDEMVQLSEMPYIGVSEEE